MVHDNLTSRHLSRNDVQILTQIFETKLKYFSENMSPFERDYFRTLRTFVGLGYTAALEDGDAISLYQPRLDAFLKLLEDESYTLSVSYFSQLIAEMIDLTLWYFRFIARHEYGKEFSLLVDKTINSLPWPDHVSREEVRRLSNVIQAATGVFY